VKRVRVALGRGLVKVGIGQRLRDLVVAGDVEHLVFQLGGRGRAFLTSS
jgi:hypothetical protein